MRQQVKHKQFRPKRSQHRGRKRTLALLCIAGLVTLGLIFAFAQRPRRVAEQGRRSSGAKNIVRIKAGGDLQAALNAAQPGDTLVLEAGATYYGPFTLPYKAAGTNTDADYITIQSSALDSLPDNRRVTPAQARFMPRLTVRDLPREGYSPNVIRTEPRAHHYKLIGLNITTEPTKFNYDLMALGNGSEEQNMLAQVPHNLVVDRCLIHVSEKQPAKRGIALNSADTVISNSHIAGFKHQSQETHALAIWNGPGRYTIENNYMEAAGVNLMIIGAANWIPSLIPSDITIRRNHFTKLLSWKPGHASYAGTQWAVKNLLELKTGKRVTIDGNLFEYAWQGEQNGNAVGFVTISNGRGSAPQLEDITFTHNIVRHAAGGVWMDGREEASDGSYLRRVIIKNNLFEDIDGRWGDNQGRLFVVNDYTDGVTIEHNTALNSGDAVYCHVGGNKNFVSRNNIFRRDVGSGLNPGEATLARCFLGAVWMRNVQIGAERTMYNSSRSNFFPMKPQEVGFVNFAGGNYRLAPTSRFKNAGTDGKDIGCDFDALATAQGENLSERAAQGNER